MAKQNSNGVTGSVQGAEDGFLYIRGLEDKSLQNYLDTYAATIAGYRQTPGDMFTNVTMKIEFPNADNENNVNLWAYFIVKAAHPTAAKPRIKVQHQDVGYVAFCTWPIWNEVKFMVSKNQRSNVEF